LKFSKAAKFDSFLDVHKPGISISAWQMTSKPSTMSLLAACTGFSCGGGPTKEP